jgi:MerR family transcriptional regulator/heat shock protein HspR
MNVRIAQTFAFRGNTRLYTDTDLERLEVILSLTRELGRHLAGVEIILNMREKMDAMQREFERFFEHLRNHMGDFAPPVENFSESEALIPISRLNVSIKRVRNENDD